MWCSWGTKDVAPRRAAAAPRPRGAGKGAGFLQNSAGKTMENVAVMIRGRRGWGFPKGHIEAGETAETAACREALEETGISIRLLPDFRFATVSGLEHEDRKLYYFLAEPAGGTLRPQPGEVREAEWIPAAEAEARIRFAEDVPAFRAAWERYRILGGDPAPDSPAS